MVHNLKKLGYLHYTEITGKLKKNEQTFFDRKTVVFTLNN